MKWDVKQRHDHITAALPNQCPIKIIFRHVYRHWVPVQYSSWRPEQWRISTGGATKFKSFCESTEGKNQCCSIIELVKKGSNCLLTSVSGPDPYSTVVWIRIRIPNAETDPDKKYVESAIIKEKAQLKDS
jgi:hypothetical protein